MPNRLQSEHLGKTEWSGSGAKIQRRKRKSDWMNTPMKFDLTTYLCFIGILALHLRDSTYLSSKAMDVSKNISDLTQAMLGESSHHFLTLKKTNIIRNPCVSIPLFCIYFKNHVHVNSIHKSYFIDLLARWLQVNDNVVDILAIR